jgi:hypothetical protein
MSKPIVMVVKESAYKELLEELQDALAEVEDRIIIKVMRDAEFDALHPLEE